MTLASFYGGWAASWQMKLVFGLLSVSFVAASLRGWYSFRPLVRAFYAAAAVWLGLFSFLFWASVICWIVYFASTIAGRGWERQLIADAGFAAAVLAKHWILFVVLSVAVIGAVIYTWVPPKK